MRILIDVVHPAHVHFYRHLRDELIADGHQVLVVARGKDVTLDLLNSFEIEHISTGPAIVGGLMAQAGELANRVVFLRRQIKRFRPGIVLTRNPSGVQAARLAGVPVIFDTDDGRAAGVHFWAAAPFATVITSPACLKEDYGRRHRRYRGLKAHAYLHPRRFEFDPGIRTELELEPGEALFVVRFSAYTASHDRGVEGLSASTKQALERLLRQHGRVLISDERRRSGDALPVAADRMHQVLAAADLCVGDSQTVAAEAAILGTPAIRLSAFSDRIDYLVALEQQYGLIQNFRPGEEDRFLTAVGSAVANLPDLAQRAATGHARLLADSVDVTTWYRDLIYEMLDAG